MGMLGQWVSAPVPTRRLDEVLNEMDETALDQLIARIEGGDLFLDFRADLGFTAKKNIGSGKVGNSEDDHVVRHWFNDRDEGWWPEFPVEEIRTEAIYRVAKCRKANPSKKVSSVWMCPSAEFFGSLVHESEHGIFVVYLSPPEGSSKIDPQQSPNRPGYIRMVNEYFANDKSVHGPVNVTKVSKREYRLEAPPFQGAVADEYWVGRRICILKSSSKRIFRTVVDFREEGGVGQTIVVRERDESFTDAPDPLIPEPDLPAIGERMQIVGLSDLRAKRKAEPARNLAIEDLPDQTTWTITGIDMGGSSNNVRSVTPAVTGVSVKVNVELPL